ncbi:hypothetical protein FNL55_10820 [Tardiphaga sp. vice352]|uniref:hypothetical protein n=1 Tax=Tardiphaga sp. vice352 TaxID=2592816 RepID=UPI001163ACAA|nr:hypothetical protein [Tardiphaga sp. vice352]QDM31753.1 hypothetical protein FNL55_10820 [Tardiphaga sp. vice352]
MSRSRRIFKLIQPQVPGTVLCGDHLIITPTTDIARGFFLDTTSRKDHMMLVRTVMPLHVAWMSGNRMLPFRTDLGINHYMLGNIQEALAIFRQLHIDLDEYSPATQQNCRTVIQQVLYFLENDPVGLRAVIESWRDENIEKLGL